LQRHLQALRDTFVLGMLVGNADLCSSAYASHACMLPPDHNFRQGREEIRGFWQQVINSGGCGDVMVSDAVEFWNDRLIERGVYARFDQPVALGPPVARGSYILVIERQADGTFAWASDVRNEGHRASS
jgi:hypothetical protein